MFGFSIRTKQNQNGGASPRISTGSPMIGGGSPAAFVGTPGTGVKGSPKTVEVGEIDTRAPFQSVKAAVSLFGVAGGASPKAQPTTIKKPTKPPEERVLVKETQLHLIMKELDGLKEQLRNTEATKTQALRDLDKAKRTLNELTGKLETICEAKQAAIEATESAKIRAEELETQKSSNPAVGTDAYKQHVDSEREQYKASAGELNYAKQELANLRQDFDAVLAAKLAAFQQAADAQHATTVNRERESEFAKEVSTLRETLAQVKLAPIQAQEESAKINAERDAHLQSLKAAKEEADEKLSRLRAEADPTINKSLAAKLEETNATIEVLREQLNNVKTSDMEAWRDASSELENAKQALQEILIEQESIKNVVDSLRDELENLKKNHEELREKAAETGSIVEGLQSELEKSKKELEEAIAGVTKPEEEFIIKIQGLTLEAERAMHEAEEMNKSAEIYRQEAETAQLEAIEAERKLEIALKEAEEAKAAQKVADYKIHSASQKFANEGAANSETSGRIKLSAEEYESLSNRVEKLRSEADVKVATALAQVESITTSERELIKKLEESMRQYEEVQTAIQDAIKRTEMDEAAKIVVECELLKWRHQEHDQLGESSCT